MLKIYLRYPKSCSSTVKDIVHKDIEIYLYYQMPLANKRARVMTQNGDLPPQIYMTF